MASSLAWGFAFGSNQLASDSYLDLNFPSTEKLNTRLKNIG